MRFKGQKRGICNYFHDVKIYYLVVKMYFFVVKIYYHVEKIVLYAFGMAFLCLSSSKYKVYSLLNENMMCFIFGCFRKMPYLCTSYMDNKQ